jgi:hypothetical protein
MRWRRSGLTRVETEIVGYALTIAIGDGWIDDPDEVKQAQKLLAKLNNEMEMEKKS